ncbi:hypothetical protein E2L08_09805, partial [Palleronia sediminis]
MGPIGTIVAIVIGGAAVLGGTIAVQRGALDGMFGAPERPGPAQPGGAPAAQVDPAAPAPVAAPAPDA